MTLYLDGNFSIEVKAGWMVLESSNFFYFYGKPDEHLGDKSYLVPEKNRVIAGQVSACVNCPHITVQVTKGELDRLLGISKMVEEKI